MSKRPLLLYIIPILLLMTAASIPLQVLYLYEHDLTELTSIIQKISPLNWLSIGLMLFTAHALFSANKSVRFLVPFTIFCVSLNNYFVGQWGNDFSFSQSLFSTLGFALLFAPLLHSSVFQILKNPKHKWWSRSERFKANLPVSLNPFVGQTILANTFDISTTGLFITIKSEDLSNLPKVGETLRLSLNFNSMKKIKCEAKVVRIASPSGIYPQGLGLQFIEPNRKLKHDLRKHLASVQALSA